MEKIYLILAHNNPAQLARLIRTLDDGNSSFYIHLDAKSDIDLFTKHVDEDFFIEERVDCIWGNFNIVIATINLIQKALKNHTYGMCILMSGNDYPIKSNYNINSYLSNNSEKIFMKVIEAEKLWSSFNKRIEDYQVNFSSTRGSYIILKKGLNLKLIKLYFRQHISFRQFVTIAFKKRKLKLNMKFYGGCQWWAMNISHLTLIYDFIQIHKKVLYDFFSHSHVPDEFFFQSIIMHMKKTGYQFEIEDSITYINWTRTNCILPVTFDRHDINELLKQPPYKLFARKFDLVVDKHICELLDKSNNNDFVLND